MNLQPRNEFVIVRRIQVVNHAGLVIPGHETHRTQTVVEAVGPGGLTIDGKRMPIEHQVGQPMMPGDVVYLRGGEYETYEYKGEPYFIVPQSAILGVELAEEGTLN